MADLYNQLVSDTPTYYGQVEQNEWMKDPLNDVALNDDWAIPSLLSTFWGVPEILPFLPYAKDIWKGRGLLFHKPFSWMTPKEYTNFGKRGKQFYKEVLHPQSAKNKKFNLDASFPNSRAMESDYKYMEQYPLTRKNINDAQEKLYTYPKNYGGHKLRTDAEGFNNLKVKWKGQDYAYQIRDNAGHIGNDFYNIKPYSEAIKDKQQQDYYSKLFENLLNDY